MIRGKRISKGTSIGLIVAGDLVLLLLGWFLLVSPQRSTAQTTARAAQAAEVQIEQAQAPAAQPTVATQPKQPEIQTAYLYKLSKAMPMTTDMPNLLLELNQVVPLRRRPARFDHTDCHRSHDRCDGHHLVGRRRLLLADRSAVSTAQPCRGAQRRARCLRTAVLDHVGRPHAVGYRPDDQRQRFSHGIHVRRLRSSGRRYCGARVDGYNRYVDGRDDNYDAKRVG